VLNLHRIYLSKQQYTHFQREFEKEEEGEKEWKELSLTVMNNE
jgi:hypothetical protein